MTANGILQLGILILTSQKEYHHNGVDDRKPVNLSVTHCKITIPPRSPTNMAELNKQHIWIKEKNIWDMNSVQHFIILKV